MSELEKFMQNFKNWESSQLLFEFAQFISWTALIFFLSWLIRKSISRSFKDNTIRYRLKKIVRFVSYIFVLLLLIVTFTSELQYFTVSIGLISAGIAFALQEVILSVAGWFAIFGSNIYKPGDRIEINGIKGDVIDIGVTRTTLMEIGEWVKSDNYSGRIVQISNAFVFKGAVHNYSADFPFVWDEIDIPIKYGSDITLANQIIVDVAKRSLLNYTNFAKDHWKVMVSKYLIENANIDATVTFKLTDNWIEFNLRYVVDFKKRRITKNELFKDILREINKTSGKVTFASATFEIVGMPNLTINNENQ
ncbi:mechanosensitive ion channel family protein [Lutibacter sp.]|uniref:mechanosensitive ion channel family protein n=1 Tax=Lutibacter sp. TaxID=1925666 RepID=UPI003565A93F